MRAWKGVRMLGVYRQQWQEAVMCGPAGGGVGTSDYACWLLGGEFVNDVEVVSYGPS